jgi:ubiquinone/menaquinone biosynthesis C-methylase UbiE
MMNAHCLLRDYVRAREIAPYGDDVEVGRVTRTLLDHGHSILQSHKLAATDREHVAVLLDYFDPPQGASVLDVGCGVGTVAALMAEQRPDLRFTLLNISGAQRELAPFDMEKVRADMHALPLPAGSFDAVMFNYSLGHGLLDQCIAEAARVLRHGGVLFIYDLATHDHDYLIDHLGYRPHSQEEVWETAKCHGMTIDVMQHAHAIANDFIVLIGADAYKALGFDRTWPMIYRFTKVSA